MTFRYLTLATAILLTQPVWAQTAVPSTPEAAATGSVALVSAKVQARRDLVKAERETCRNQAKTQGLAGPAIHAAVHGCLKKVDPVAARHMQCVDAARAQYLAGDEMKGSVRQCMKAS